MQILHAAWSNFGPYGPMTRLDLHEAGLVRIEAENLDDASTESNGGGKTTIIDVIVWVLFGVTTHVPSAIGDEVINRAVGKDCFGEVTLTVKRQSYTVRRGRECTGKLKRLLGAKTGVALLDSTGAPLSGRTTKQTQEKIDALVGMSRSTFMHTVVFGQSRAYRFSQLPDSEKKAVLDELLNTELYSRAAAKAQKKVADLDREAGLLRTRQREVSIAHEAHIKAVERMTEELMHVEATRKKNLEAASRVVADLVERQTQLTILATTLDDCVGEVRVCRKRVETLQAKLDKERKARTNCEANTRGVRASADELEERMKATSKRGTRCVECSQYISPEQTEDQVAAMAIQVKDYRKAIANAVGVTKELDASITGLSARISKARSTESAAVAAMATAQTAAKELPDVAAKIKAAEEHRSSVRAEEADVERLQDGIEAEQLASLQLMAEHHDLEFRVTDLVTKQAQLSFWAAGFGTKGLRSLMLDAVLPFLNAKAQEYSIAITDGNIAIQFQTLRTLKTGASTDEFTVAVNNGFGANLYHLCSNGERAKIDLCVGLALQDLAMTRSHHQVNVAFFDEPFDGLDDVAMDRVMDLLASVLKTRESVFVITHHSSLKSHISKSITVVKEGGISRLEA